MAKAKNNTLRTRLLRTARRLLAQPVAPFRERHARGYIENFCNDRGIPTRRDALGNVIATYGPDHPDTNLAFAAHMDHPGFIIEKDSAAKTTTAIFYGHVEEEYFRSAKVQVFTEAGPVTARITKTNFNLKTRTKRVHLRLEASVQKGDLGTWLLTPYELKNNILHSRNCDDGAGCVAILTFLDELAHRRIRKKVTAIFTIAEEAGLHGAKYICVKKALPKKTVIIAIETSSETPAAKIGNGVVIRVGDASNIFTPEITKFMTAIAKKTKDSNKNFKYQRKLMDGGTCESSIYYAFGYKTGAVAIPLGNYHNRNFKKKKIEPEFVSAADLENMTTLFVELVRNCRNLQKFLNPGLPVYKKQTRDLGETFFTGSPGKQRFY